MPSHTTKKAETFLQKLGDFFDPRNLIQMPEYPTAQENLPPDALKRYQDSVGQGSTKTPFAGQLYDAVKGGFSNLGDFLFGDEDFNYMERSKDERDDATRRFIEKQLEDARMRSQFGSESPELFQERLEAAKMMADREDMRPLPRQGQGLKSRSIAEQMLEAQKFIDPYRVPFGREPFRGIGGMRFKP